MRRLIDANEVRTKAIPLENLDGNGIPYEIMAVSVDAIDDMPTVHAVEVVRCKDCKYYKRFKGCGNWCHRRIRSDIEYRTKPNDFCSYGERKDNG